MQFWEAIRLAVMMYVRFSLSLRNVEDLLHERGIKVCLETVRYWWLQFPYADVSNVPVNALRWDLITLDRTN
jgi:transposase-like protein